MVVVDDVMLFWLLCCVDVWNKRGVIVALLVGPLALVIVEVVRLVPSHLICFCPLLLCDHVFFTKCLVTPVLIKLVKIGKNTCLGKNR